MKKLLYTLQIILKWILTFLFSFIWLRFFINTIWLALAISFALTIIIEFIHRLYRKKTNTQKDLKIKEKECADNMFLSLVTGGNYMKFYEDMLLSRHNNVITKKNYLIVKKESEKSILFPLLKLEKLKADDLIQIMHKVRNEKADKISIICCEYDKETVAFINNFNQKIILLDRFECYSLYKEYDFYPDITEEYKKEAKLSFKDLLAIAFNKSRTKSYLISAIILFITSFFVKINIYYCIISSLLLMFALISYINPKYNKKNIQEVI